MASIMFGSNSTSQFVLTQKELDAAKEALAEAIKSGLPKETRRVDVLCYIFDEMKKWAREQMLEL